MAAPAPSVPSAEIRQQVARIIASPQFNRSNRLARFLQFIVESALSGDSNSPKEWVIGAEVYGRGENFDPRLDSIVRTEARRLRRKLAEYYESEGRDDALVIELATGSYDPVFRIRRESAVPETPPEKMDSPATEVESSDLPPITAPPDATPAQDSPSISAPPSSSETHAAPPIAVPSKASPAQSASAIAAALGRRWWPALLVLIGVFVLIYGRFVYWLYSEAVAIHLRPVHRLALLSVRCSPEDKEGQELASAFIGDLDAHLRNEGTVDVVESQSVLQFTPEEPAISQIGSKLKADHVLTATLEKSQNGWYLSVRMIRVWDQSPVWTGRFDSSWSTIGQDETEILNDVLSYCNTNRVSGTHRSVRARDAEEYSAYARARDAVRLFTVSYDQIYADYAQQQLTLALTADPDFGDATVLLAKLHSFQMLGSPDQRQLLEASRSLLEALLKQEPRRADANALLAGVYADLGQRDRGMDLARHALQLGPLDSEARDQMGHLYTEAGFCESAIIEDDRSSVLDPTDLTPLLFRQLCLSWIGKQAETEEALKEMQQRAPTPVTDLLAIDQEMREGNLEAAERRISSGREHASVFLRTSFDIADGLRAALAGNRAEASRTFEQYKNSPVRFFDHIILLATLVGEHGQAIERIRQNPLYSNYRYLINERRLAPLRGEAKFRALLQETYRTWQHDLSRYGPSLPVPPPPVPSPEEFLAQD